jgi:hypothetical protein
LRIYEEAYGLAMEIFKIGKQWPIVNKLTDADAENSEIDTCLDFSKDFGYLSDADHHRLTKKCGEIGVMLGSMLNNPTPFLLKNRFLTPAFRHLTPDLKR